MMRILLFVFILFVSLQINYAQKPITSDDKTVKAEINTALTDKLLYVWYPAIIDSVNGGFYTNFSDSWQRLPRQEKMIVTQTRGIWTACKAAEHFPGDKRYRQAADHGFKYLRDVMWDKTNGGFYTLTGAQSSNSRWECKNTYGNGFAIYALAAYYRLTKNPEALTLAKKTFYWLDSVAYDSKHGGYFNFLCQSKQKMESGSFDGTNGKDFNSSIHIMEALAELYSVWPDELVKSRLTEMLILVRDRFTNPKGYLQLYFTADWKHISYRDSSVNTTKKHIDVDHVSFGHDIETAFLLLETSRALKLKNDTLTLRIAKQMVDHTLAHGFDKNFSGIFEGGYYFKGSDSVTIVMDNKNWWSQAEGLNALLLFSKLYPNEKIYKKAFYQLWDYTKKYIIDYTHGDWYNNGLDRSPNAQNQQKASAWKCNYHTGRSLMNCLDLLNGKNILH